MADGSSRNWLVFRSLQGGAASWRADLVAGLTLAAIAAPEQMATARLGGFAPHIGFYVFIAGSLAFALFGANRYLSSGADSTITPIFAASLAAMAPIGGAEYLNLAALLSVIVGVFLAGAGVFRAGWVANLFSIPVLTGFLGGIAVHIALSEAPAFLGLVAGSGSSFDRMAQIIRQFEGVKPLAVLTGSACFAFIAVVEWAGSRFPGPLLALAGATVATMMLGLEGQGLPTVGAFHVTPPRLAAPIANVNDFGKVLGLSAIIAAVVMAQSAATSRSFPGFPGEAADIDRDFLGLGLGSMLSGLFGAFPVNASPPRTAIVAEAGAETQIAGVTAAVAVALVAAFGESFLSHTPEAALAAILFYIAGRIFRLGAMRDIAARSRPEFILLLATLLLVVLVPVQTGVALAIILSLIHGLWTTTQTDLHIFERFPGKTIWWPENDDFDGETLAGVKVVGFQAPLSFLNADRFRRELVAAAGEPGLKLLILEASAIDSIDYTAAQGLAAAIGACRHKGVDFAIARLESVRAQAAFACYGLFDALGAPGVDGRKRLFRSVDEATSQLAGDARAISTPAVKRQS
ncbi:SulP family inorganic anion transporter [Rhodoblastus sp. 17X3]|uniref:SulP family inorganic anion transporter n=1 Tax=Rhodoblastus sp. 17X3 TaxID=3047026 RepID=UPI0024B8090D|nr:SulP family inorganic anion transporter [Rhodoblastus sp. 17X3]MDI9848952.1 SulP family inorganic anion transporter [Rhodoblastus sp. 17X3]